MTTVVTIRGSGLCLRLLRKQFGWTQRELAERAGVSEKTVWRFEHGLKCYPNTARLLAAAVAPDNRGDN